MNAKILIPQLISNRGAWFTWYKNADNIFNNLTYQNKFRCIYDEYVEDNNIDKYYKHVYIRNKIVDNNLTDEYTHVFWMDVDVVEYPFDIIEKLLSVASDQIVAPYVFIEDNDWWKWKRFYDISCFIDSKGKNFNYQFPYNISDGDIKSEVQSVGTCFLIPAEIHRKIKYEINNNKNEHILFFEKARNLGYKIIADPNIEIRHAFLPKYGENFH